MSILIVGRYKSYIMTASTPKFTFMDTLIPMLTSMLMHILMVVFTLISIMPLSMLMLILRPTLGQSISNYGWVI